MRISFLFEGKEYKLDLQKREENDIVVALAGKQFHVSVQKICDDNLILKIDGKIYDVIVNPNAHSYSVYVKGRFFNVEKKSTQLLLAGAGEKSGRKEIRTSMPGKIVKVLVKKGEEVKKDQPVLVLEAMKMQNEIKSPQSGIITQIELEPGASVEANAFLFAVE